MSLESGAFVPDDDNYNHILSIYVPSLHIYFEDRCLFGKNYPIYYNGKYYKILEKYSKNIISDFNYNDLRNIKVIKYDERSLESEIILKVRNFLMKGVNFETKNDVIFIERKDRKMTNVSKIFNILKDCNLHVKSIKFEDLKFEEQIKIANESKMMVGVHGAGLTNLMFMKNNAIVLEIDPFNWGFNCYEHLANNLKMQNYFRLCDEITKNKYIKNIEIDFSKFEKKIKNFLVNLKHGVIV